jgi:RNA polymerase sigma-70 factor (ECF subfamily)
VSHDAELIARALDGHPEAFGTLVDRYYDDCLRMSWRMLGHRQDAEDALQETFLSAYRALGRYREQDNFRAWLYRILVNQCRTLARQRVRHASRVVNDESLVNEAIAASDGHAMELRDELQSALATLDPMQREAFLLKYGAGFEYTEMARITGAGISALKMRVRRAAEHLRPRLETLRHE